MNVVMNVTAYAEALRFSLEVDVGDHLVVRVISIPGLVALKLLSWNDRLLGQDTRLTLEEPSRNALLAVLGDTRKRERLIVHMAPRFAESGPEIASKLLSQFELGLNFRKS